MLGDDIPTALSQMKDTDSQQHCDGLLQEFYSLAQKLNEPIGKYAVRHDMAAGKVQLQSPEALGGTDGEVEQLLIDCLLHSINPNMQSRIAHMVDGKPPG